MPFENGASTGPSLAQPKRRFIRGLGLLAMTVWMTVGCRAPEPCCRRAWVGAALDSRMGQTLGPDCCPGETCLPPDCDPDDGLTEEEAVAIALWNNAAHQEMLSQLGVSRAQLLEAGLLTDPLFTALLPVGPKQLEFALTMPLEAFWLRPVRVRAAQLDLDQLSTQMVQNGLDLIRDVRLAHADLLLAQQRAELAVEAEKLRADIAELAQKRLRAGDISELEATDSRTETLRAAADAAWRAQDVLLASDKLKTLIGLTLRKDMLLAVASPMPGVPEQTSGDLLDEAFAMRPDWRAAEIAVESARQRVSLARRQFMTFGAIFDAKGQGDKGFECGPGLDLRIPLFNRNQGGIAIAEANLEQASRRYVTVRDRIAAEVRAAHTQLMQAHENLQIVKTRILPALDTAVTLARKSYQAGDTSYFLVLQTTGQFLDARARELELSAARRRAAAELERSVGRRVLTGN